MSIDRCHVCDDLVDTDARPEAYAEVVTYSALAMPAHPRFKERVEWVCVCESCAEDYVDEQGLYWPDGVKE